MRPIKPAFQLLLVFIICYGCGEGKIDDFTKSDDFETGHLADFWRPGNKGSGRYEKDAVTITDQYQRSGNKCAKLVVQKGFIRQDGGDGNFTERTELDSGAHPFLNYEVWYAHSFFLPKDFPIVDNRLVISQVKQKVLFGNTIQLFAHRFRNGSHYLTIYDMTKDEKERSSRIELPKLTKEKWHDFLLQIYYSETSEGYINMWMDGEKVVSFKGVTASKKGRNRFYHKIGMYRDQWPDAMTLYVDDYLMTTDTTKVDKLALFDKLNQ
ncbi:polysaccharide lyase [Ulvibacterium sp.]|uniref:polysaccharide lyase n=1 Tax=Ulvibacterium sp. TaxID=2665914 RepID=UPI003BAC18F8